MFFPFYFFVVVNITLDSALSWIFAEIVVIFKCLGGNLFRNYGYSLLHLLNRLTFNQKVLFLRLMRARPRLSVLKVLHEIY